MYKVSYSAPQRRFARLAVAGAVLRCSRVLLNVTQYHLIIRRRKSGEVLSPTLLIAEIAL